MRNDLKLILKVAPFIMLGAKLVELFFPAAILGVVIVLFIISILIQAFEADAWAAKIARKMLNKKDDQGN